MAIYAISDLHLSLSMDKPMDVFGSNWTGYMDRIKKNWEEKINPDDFVIIPGDISWATYIDQAYEDFRFIESLPGKKIIFKGNHDYWWTTMSKLDKYVESNGFSTINFLHNNSFDFGEMVLCGTRGWKCPGDDGITSEDVKIFEREVQRLDLSLSDGSKSGKDIIAALHYPPFNARKEPTKIVDILKKYPVKTCVYGHLHGESSKNAFRGEYSGILFELVSADFINFDPIKL